MVRYEGEGDFQLKERGLKIATVSQWLASVKW